MKTFPNLIELLDAAAEGADNDNLESPYTDEELAGIALDLSDVYTGVSKALEPLKGRLRERARQRLISGGGETDHRVLFEGVDEDGEASGTVVVTFPPKQVRLPKGTDTDRLRRDLGALFDDYFDTVVTVKPKRDLPAILSRRVAAGEAEEADLLLNTIEYIDPTPRVGFKSTEN